MPSHEFVCKYCRHLKAVGLTLYLEVRTSHDGCPLSGEQFEGPCIWQPIPSKPSISKVAMPTTSAQQVWHPVDGCLKRHRCYWYGLSMFELCCNGFLRVHFCLQAALVDGPCSIFDRTFEIGPAIPRSIKVFRFRCWPCTSDWWPGKRAAVEAGEDR